MIICSRCGKENQDLYKFCLGCGSKLSGVAPAQMAVEAQYSAPTTAPVAPIAQPVLQQSVPQTAAPIAFPGASPFSPNLGKPTPAVGTKAINPSGEIEPTLHVQVPPAAVSTPARLASPPAGVPISTPISFQQTNKPATAVQAAIAAAMPSSVQVQIGLGSEPVQVPASMRPSVAGHPSQVPSAKFVSGLSTATPVKVATAIPATTASPHASPFSPPVVEMIPCPNCGKQVASAFAFCGGCGHRMKPTPGAIAEPAMKRPEAIVPQPVRVGPQAHLTLIRPDGTEGGMFSLREGANLVGRGQGVLFDADPYLSPRHAEFQLTDDGLEARDLRSLNGVFVRITDEEPLASGDTFRIGQELLRFDIINQPTPLEDGTEIIGTPNPGYWGRLSVIVGRDVDGPAFPLFDETALLGRERGDILFPEDGYVSGAHCQLTLKGGQVFLKDVGSSNGTFLRVRENRVLPSGSLLLMGQQLFRIAIK